MYIYLRMPWEGHQAYMRSERDAGKKRSKEGQGGTYRVIPLRGQNGGDERGGRRWRTGLNSGG